MDFIAVGKIAPDASPSQVKPGVIHCFVSGYSASAVTSLN
jgi:hypothetical protein